MNQNKTSKLFSGTVIKAQKVSRHKIPKKAIYRVSFLSLLLIRLRPFFQRPFVTPFRIQKVSKTADGDDRSKARPAVNLSHYYLRPVQAVFCHKYGKPVAITALCDRAPLLSRLALGDPKKSRTLSGAILNLKKVETN